MDTGQHISGNVAESNLAETARPETGPWGHILVSASACILTVSILGSAIFLAHKIYTQYELRGRVRSFIASLDNRTPAELADRAALLRQRPKLAAHFLPEIAAALRQSRSEKQLCAAILLSEEFVDHKRIRAALVELRADPREIVAAAAVRALARVQPPETAAALLGGGVKDAASGTLGPAALDESHAGLVSRGATGLTEVARRLPQLSVDRRVWLTGYVNDRGGPDRAGWLGLLKSDSDPRVRTAAEQALIGAPHVRAEKASTGAASSAGQSPK